MKNDKKINATKNDVLFDAFEVAFILTVSHDAITISLPAKAVTLVKATVEAFHADTSARMLYTFRKVL